VAEEGTLGPHLRLLALVAAVHEEATGKHLPINGAGAGGAALAEEAQQPIGRRLAHEVDQRASRNA
jgi:hypothetical protein